MTVIYVTSISEPESMGGWPSEGPETDVFQHLPQQHMD
jgi:hypothetical protein